MAKQTDCWWFHNHNFYRNSTSTRCFRCCQALLDRLNQCLISGTVGFLCQRVLTDCCRGEPSRYPAWPQCQLEPQPMDHGARWCLVPGGATRRRSWEFLLASFVLAIGPDFFCWALLRSRVVQLCLCTYFILFHCVVCSSISIPDNLRNWHKLTRSNTAGPAIFQEATPHSARLRHHTGRRGAVQSKASHGTGARFHCSQRTDIGLTVHFYACWSLILSHCWKKKS